MEEKFTIEFEKVCPMCSENCSFFEFDNDYSYYEYEKKVPNYRCRNKPLCMNVYRATVDYLDEQSRSKHSS